MDQKQNFITAHFMPGLIAVTAVWCLAIATSVKAVSVDLDGDGVTNSNDNCSNIANPLQTDADNDGFGNLCDADLDNNLVINFPDFSILTSKFLQSDPVADLNVDGTVNFPDISIFADSFLEPPGPSGVAASNLTFGVTQVFASVAIGLPIDMKQTASQPDRWYLLQRNGRIINFSTLETTTESAETLNIISSVDTTFEGGALGFAFDPDFANNGYIYVSYTATGPNFATPLVSRLSRFDSVVVDGVSVADPASEVILLSVDQPYSNHNGGYVEFGHDGYLYWGLGDGGSSGDPLRHGQNTQSLLGAMIRLDVHVSAVDFDQGIRYYIPPDNPFATDLSCAVGCPEIYAWGFRNPWRWSFDRLTGQLWAGDVGQNSIEEISVVQLGGNHGWRCYEGDQTYNTSGCDLGADFVAPVHTYTHSVGYSVTGGYVYRGDAHPELHGMYIFADFGSGTIWGLFEGDYAGVLASTSISPVSFAENLAGELYIVSLPYSGTPRIMRLDIN